MAWLVCNLEHHGRTLLRGICLHEAFSRTCFLELWSKPGKLGEVLVNYADLGGEIVFVNVFCEVSSGVA